jgi:hypothetical protein
VVAQLHQGRHIQRPVELSVAAPVEAHALHLAGAGRDGCHAGQRCERIVAAEAADVTHLAQQLGRDQGADAGDLEQWMTGHLLADPGLEPTCLGAQPAQGAQPLSGQLGLDTGAASQPAGQGGQRARPDQRAAAARQQHQQVGVQPVAGAGRLGHQVLARLDQQLQLASRVGATHRRQVRLAQHDARDGQRVAWVALARTAGADPLAAGQVRRHLPHRLTGVEQETRQRRAIRGRALDADDRGRIECGGPGGQRGVPGTLVGEGHLGHCGPAVIDGAGCQAGLVGVDPRWRSM